MLGNYDPEKVLSEYTINSYITIMEGTMSVEIIFP